MMSYRITTSQRRCGCWRSFILLAMQLIIVTMAARSTNAAPLARAFLQARQSPTSSSTTLSQGRAMLAGSQWDKLYDDDNIHFAQLIRTSDWLDRAWGVRTMAPGQRLQYDKYQQLPYTSWRLMRDPNIDRTVSQDNTILMSTSFVNIVSRDGRLVWACGPDGYVQLVDYATALQAGSPMPIRARIVEKHGLSYFIGKPLVRGFEWVKLKFNAEGGTDVTPTDSGLAWRPMSDASYAANRVAYAYGFQVQDVDFTDPTIL